MKLACALFGALLLAGGFQTAGADSLARPALLTSHPLLKERLERIAAGSSLWRSALDTVAKAGRRAVVLTSEDVVVAQSPDGGGARPFDPGVLAEVSPVRSDGTAVETVTVVINLPLIEALHEQNNALPAELHADLDRILIHEIFGHAIPYLLVGDVSGHCADPAPGQRATDACAIQRENAVRAELRLGKRIDSGLGSLALARSLRTWR